MLDTTKGIKVREGEQIREKQFNTSSRWNNRTADIYRVAYIHTSDIKR